MNGFGQALLRIGMAMVAGLFWTIVAGALPVVGGSDPVEVVLRGGAGVEIAITVAVMVAALAGYAVTARFTTGSMRKAGS